MNEAQCKKCYAIGFYTFHPFVNPRKKHKFDPDFLFHVGVYCTQCKKNSGFIPQTVELMTSLLRAYLTPKNHLPLDPTNNENEEE